MLQKPCSIFLFLTILWNVSGMYIAMDDECIICKDDIPAQSSTYTKCSPVPHGPFHQSCLKKSFGGNSQVNCPYCRQRIFLRDHQTFCEKLSLVGAKLLRYFASMILRTFTSTLLYASLDIIIITLLFVLFALMSNPRIPTSHSFKTLTVALAVVLSISRFLQILFKYHHWWGGMLCQCTGLNQDEILTYHLEFHANDFRFSESLYGKVWGLFFNLVGLIEVSALAHVLSTYFNLLGTQGEF
jgi:hypothetical protein